MIAKLPKQTEEQIQRLVDSGEYDDSTDVVVRAVRSLVQQQDALDRERALVRAGIAQARTGRTIPDSAEFRRELREAARQLAASGTPIDPDDGG